MDSVTRRPIWLRLLELLVLNLFRRVENGIAKRVVTDSSSYESVTINFIQFTSYASESEEDVRSGTQVHTLSFMNLFSMFVVLVSGSWRFRELFFALRALGCDCGVMVALLTAIVGDVLHSLRHAFVKSTKSLGDFGVQLKVISGGDCTVLLSEYVGEFRLVILLLNLWVHGRLKGPWAVKSSLDLNLVNNILSPRSTDEFKNDGRVHGE
ncbi:hypothetical protein H5410_036837 [Solanum commersonii]|uniref:Uncharacterized protein n=1 Tax=Solanum commersonii TaxID=4109 RepID=A0A9J5Y608_SOLCO|nr:hypothetical protein H5410_036837 [Solanum commersonii]